MKKVIYILVGVFTFSISLLIFHLRPFVISVSLCEISENAQFYESKQINVKAFLVTGGYYDVTSGIKATDFRNGCSSEVNIEISEELKKNETFSKIDDELFEKRREPQNSGTDGWAIVEVEFVGELKANRKSGIYDKPKFTIKATKVRQVSPIKFITLNEVSILNKDLVLY